TEAGKYEKAIAEARSFMVDNRASAEMEEYLKTAYTKQNPEEDFESYLSSIKEEALANQRRELEKDMLNEDAPSFKLKDLEGNEIALADLKGKTVILDFWATWCGPCKMSFPGMQDAVEKYADNENVEFLFINTWEQGENREQDVSNFIDENNYSFHVLMDELVAEGNRDFTVVSEYGISGIPTKIIIGPEGKIKFRKVGYEGNNAKLLQEIGLMIELTQNNKSPQA
ncbi:MAG: TlpA disulfide reductase family protein, partial [Christiangramia sp.]|nr:TlpA disulfide reductase family protein [Christiangramia sp.]